MGLTAILARGEVFLRTADLQLSTLVPLLLLAIQTHLLLTVAGLLMLGEVVLLRLLLTRGKETGEKVVVVTVLSPP